MTLFVRNKLQKKLFETIDAVLGREGMIWYAGGVIDTTPKARISRCVKLRRGQVESRHGRFPFSSLRSSAANGSISTRSRLRNETVALEPASSSAAVGRGLPAARSGKCAQR